MYSSNPDKILELAVYVFVPKVLARSTLCMVLPKIQFARSICAVNLYREQIIVLQPMCFAYTNWSQGVQVHSSVD